MPTVGNANLRTSGSMQFRIKGYEVVGGGGTLEGSRERTSWGRPASISPNTTTPRPN